MSNIESPLSLHVTACNGSKAAPCGRGQFESPTPSKNDAVQKHSLQQVREPSPFNSLTVSQKLAPQRSAWSLGKRKSKFWFINVLQSGGTFS